MEELWFMPPGEEIDMGGTFDFVRLNIKAQKTIRTRTMAMVQVLGENDERKIILFRKLLRTMCAETGKPQKALQSRLDACKLSVHCLYDIALHDASEAKMVIPANYGNNESLTLNDVFWPSLCSQSPRPLYFRSST